MKIEKIEKLKSGKYKLTTDNKDKIVTYDDVILKNNLLYKKELDQELLETLSKDTVYFDVYNKCIKLIIKKLRSKQEIRNFLDKFDLSKQDEDKIINDLEISGFVNDTNYIKAYISDRFNLSSDGIDKIKYDLLKQDMDYEIIDQEIAKISKEEIIEKLTKLIIKRLNLSHNQSNYNLKQKLVMYFINLGYEKSLIIEIIDKNLKNSNDVIKKEYDKLIRKYSKKYQNEKLYYFVKQKLYQKGFTNEEINNLDN